ncbi:MAG: YbhB/YbcL family Raf kinase inhibitor-like protein [Candidatus Jorgensenbacteria bacterium]|nr:YbhB/YbcL family Raf kinase inhibitor-like protein [Candidatus Jorgensenbacteria bacterium]
MFIEFLTFLHYNKPEAMRWYVVILILAVVVGAAIFLWPSKNFKNMENAFEIKSSVFKPGEQIPAKYTCDGDDISPMLEIKNAPVGTVSFALIVDDPDATRGIPWDHWILWNIRGGTQYIMEDTIPEGSVQGATSFSGKVRYGGPCPPKGNPPHRYVFKLYALDSVLDIPAGSIKDALLKAMEGHILGTAELIGLYGR